MESQIINHVSLAGSVGATDMSLMGLFDHADMVGKTIMIGLLMISMFTWALIFNKASRIASLKKRASFFEEKFWGAGSLDNLFNRIRRPADPMQAVFVAGMKEWKNASESGLLNTAQGRSQSLDRIDRVLHVTVGREMALIETYMTFLASVSSVAPFIGLFGTVWGIMRSFIGIAQAQNTSLVVVAPGIAEALLATAVGLIAAIPATAAYNKFTTELGRYGARLENFANDLVSTLSRNMEGDK